MRSIRFALMIVALLLGFSLQTAVNAADSSSYRVAYYSYRDKEIWMVNPDGTNDKPITHDGVDKTGLVASPDGHYLAYYVQSWYDGANTNYLTYQVVVILNIATGEQHMITGQEAITGLAWSPDSQQLLFAILTRYNGFLTNYELDVINRDGSGRTKIAETVGSMLGLSWSPDGKHILLSRQNADASYQILMMDVDGSNQHEVIHIDSCFICDHPRWTPDGQHIIFYRHPDLLIMDADGQHLRQLTDFVQVYNVVDVAYNRYGNPEYVISADSQSLVYTMGNPVELVKLGLGANSWEQRQIISKSPDNNFRGVLLAPDNRAAYIRVDTAKGQVLTRVSLDTGTTNAVATNVSEPVIVASE